jgi:hypothetical protein
MRQALGVNDEKLATLLPSDPQYPLELGTELTTEEKTQLALFLVRMAAGLMALKKYAVFDFYLQAKVYMTQVDATHCTPLPADKFSIAWFKFFEKQE